MNKVDDQYEGLLQQVLLFGKLKSDRTGTGTRSRFGAQMRWDLSQGFPLVTTKKIHFKSVVAELLWILSGSTNVKDLQAMGCTIWDEWADGNGDLGPVYGKQWRSWSRFDTYSGGEAYQTTGIDQVANLIKGLQKDPSGRRHIISAWNVADLPHMALSPCHALVQFDVTDGRLSCQMYQRSCDMFLGVPFNIASYALLTHLVAQQTGYQVGEFIWTGGDCHIYSNHTEQVRKQLLRYPYPMPSLIIMGKPKDIFSYKPEDILLSGYQHHPAISAPVAV